MSDRLPAPLSPSNPLGAPRKKDSGIDWKTAQMIHVMLCGIDAAIEDAVVGTIPASVPLSLEQAARFVHMKLKRARALRMTPEFCEAMRQATANYRACIEPGNIAVALEIRDDKLVKPKDRLKAAEFLQGPKEARAAVQVNIQNNNPGRVILPGYNIDLRNPDEKIAPTIDHEAEIVPALPSSENNAGRTSRDLDKERRENEQPRVIRP